MLRSGKQAISLLTQDTMDGLCFKALLPINEARDRWYRSQAMFESE